MLLLAGCSTNERSVLREEYASSTQIDPAAPLTLGPDEGIVVGMVAFADRNRTVVEVAFQRGARLDLVLQHGNGQRWQLRVTPSGPEDLQITDGGATMTLRPFAFRMPAGKASYAALADVIARGSMSAFSGGNMMSHAPILGARVRELPANGFTISAGQVTYVGRVGWMIQTVHFADRGTRDAACPQMQRLGGALGGALVPYGCAINEFFIGEDAERDLPAIRAAFPTVTRFESVVRPARSADSQLRAWPRVLSNPMEGVGIQHPR